MIELVYVCIYVCMYVCMYVDMCLIVETHHFAVLLNIFLLLLWITAVPTVVDLVVLLVVSLMSNSSSVAGGIMSLIYNSVQKNAIYKFHEDYSKGVYIIPWTLRSVYLFYYTYTVLR